MGFLSVPTSGSLILVPSLGLSSFDVDCQVSCPGVVDQQIKDSTVLGVLLFGYNLGFLVCFFFYFVFFFLVIDVFCFLGLGVFAVVLGFCFVFFENLKLYEQGGGGRAWGRRRV